MLATTRVTDIRILLVVLPRLVLMDSRIKTEKERTQKILNEYLFIA